MVTKMVPMTAWARLTKMMSDTIQMVPQVELLVLEMLKEWPWFSNESHSMEALGKARAVFMSMTSVKTCSLTNNHSQERLGDCWQILSVAP